MRDEGASVTVKLTEHVSSCGGCAAKWDADGLAGLLKTLSARPVPAGNVDVLVGLAPFDDAAVVSLPPGEAMISTVDFFPAVVDDPDDFGAVAAANACSDIFAMGGRVCVAVAVAGFPVELPDHVIEATLSAGTTTLEEAGGVLAGGHTIRTAEPIFGLAVQGTVRPDAIWRKGGAGPGQVLVLSKPLGTGLVINGGTDDERRAAIDGMRATNRRAAEALHRLDEPPTSVTDVTGFGLVGHAWEVAQRSGVRIRIEGSRLPAYPGALDAAARGVRTSGDARNRRYVDGNSTRSVEDDVAALAFDPQTSGGLLAAVTVEQADLLSGDGFVTVAHVEAGDESVVLTA
jgi:selenide,water dikinase